MALDDVSLDVTPNEFLSILGPSGSGKTTFLGLLGGFMQPSSGQILLGNRDITFEPPHRRDIGIVFQNYALFPHMTVGENITFPLRARRMPKADWPARLAAALAMVDLTGFPDRPIRALSGGQRQRVALARAMIFEPRLILMDEPLSALDKQLRETMQIELKALHQKLSATIVYVTHDQREALTMSDRVAVMRNGRIVQLAAPQDLHDRPVDSFVAGFIGEATILPVQRAGSGPPWRHRTGQRPPLACGRPAQSGAAFRKAGAGTGSGPERHSGDGAVHAVSGRKLPHLCPAGQRRGA